MLGGSALEKVWIMFDLQQARAGCRFNFRIYLSFRKHYRRIDPGRPINENLLDCTR